MFIAMNRFEVLRDQAAAFEAVWLTRQSRLVGEPGFIVFHLLRHIETGEGDTILFASHTVWRSRADFEAWTQSTAFQDAHKDGARTRDMLKGGPRFEGFEVVQEVTARGTP